MEKICGAVSGCCRCNVCVRFPSGSASADPHLNLDLEPLDLEPELELQDPSPQNQKSPPKVSARVTVNHAASSCSSDI